MDDLDRIFAFIVEVDRLKAVLRKTKPIGFERYENSAEHSWQVCLLALVVCRHASEPVDIHRVIEILLVHDIPEIDAGDQIVYAAHDAQRAADERRAAEAIFGLLPEPEAQMCLERWREYEARETPESVFAYAVDRMMPLLHNLEGGGLSWRENEIPVEKVLAVNSAIGDAMPAVWEKLEAAIRQCDTDGVFDFGAD